MFPISSIQEWFNPKNSSKEKLPFPQASLIQTQNLLEPETDFFLGFFETNQEEVPRFFLTGVNNIWDRSDRTLKAVNYQPDFSMRMNGVFDQTANMCWHAPTPNR